MNKILILIIIFVISSCNGTDCENLPTSFNSYIEAEKQIEKAHFNTKDEINTSKSSWIKGAKYLGCDKETGFLILKTDKQDYIHQNVPIYIWNGFKSATSFGSYYNANIKHRYQLQIMRKK